MFGELMMAISLFLELVFTESEQHFISIYNLNLAQICVEAISLELQQQHEIDGALRTENVRAEVQDLKLALRSMRLENEKLKAAQEERKPSALTRIMRGI